MVMRWDEDWTMGPAINVRMTDALHFAASAPCGQSWPGMAIAANDVSTVVLRALKHASECERCVKSSETPRS